MENYFCLTEKGKRVKYRQIWQGNYVEQEYMASGAGAAAAAATVSSSSAAVIIYLHHAYGLE